MRRLRLVGLSEDGQQVVFVDDTGAEFAATADDRLRVALHGDRSRLGQLEIEMDSALRPRDIQARIRSGESPETVATVAQVPVEKVMPYCIPVLAERHHIAQLARRSHVRRKNAEGPARTLSEVVTERLRGRGVDLSTAEWDSWRRADGRWTVETTYLSGERLRTGRFVFDAIGRYSVADDDEAKWLTGERQPTSKGPQPRESGMAGDRRLAAVPAGDDLLSQSGQGVTDEPNDAEASDDLTAVVRAVSEPLPTTPRSTEPTADSPARSQRSPDDGIGNAGGGEATSLQSPPDPEAPAAIVSPPLGDEPPPAEVNRDAEAKSVAEPDSISPVRRQPRKRAADVRAGEAAPDDSSVRRRRQRRPSVPSWDEIMFSGSTGGSSGSPESGGSGDDEVTDLED
ncbi:MAG: septation protein SepH [Nocardioidaceae bacterium]